MTPSASRPSPPRASSSAGPPRGSQSGRLLLLEAQSGRLTVLRRWLARLGAGKDGEHTLESLEDLGDLFESRLRGAPNSTLFVDAAELPLEELGLLRRWLDRTPAARLVLVGEPEDSEGAQKLWEESQPQAEGTPPVPQWLPWPPDILRLEALLEELEDSASSSPLWPARDFTAPAPTRRTTLQATELQESERQEEGEPATSDAVAAELAELREIEFILGRPGPQSLEETPSLAQSPTPPRAVAPPLETSVEQAPEELESMDSDEEPTDEEGPSLPRVDPLAVALEAAARRTPPASERDRDEERVAEFLRGLELPPSRTEEAGEVDEAQTAKLFDAELEEAVDQAIEEALLHEEIASEVADSETLSLEQEADPALTEQAAHEKLAEAPAEDFETPTGQGEDSSKPSLAPPKRHAPWFKDQVADLADIAQRIELGLSAARSADFEATLQGALKPPGSAVDSDSNPSGDLSGTEDPALSERKLSVRLDELELEVLRLSQYTRTLGYLASPPAQGLQDLDLRSLVSEWVQSQAAQAGGASFASGRTEGAPRFLLRVDEELQIASDKALLSQAFDALFYVARQATPAGQAIRVRVHPAEAGDGGYAETSIEFERGVLEGLTPDEICRPYALRRVLPELGPNSLAAARAILEGQGGRMALEDVGAGRMAWRVQLLLSN